MNARRFFANLLVLLSLVVLFGLAFAACNPTGTTTPGAPTTEVPAASAMPSQAAPTTGPIPTGTFSATATPDQGPPPSETPQPTPTTVEALRFAVIGDYGTGLEPEAQVAALVRGWEPDLVITTGDNNYPNGEAGTIDDHIGQFYAEFISPYLGVYGEGAQTNRFFPTLGNHDWNTVVGGLPQPYLDYFSLPGNERYYDFVRGPVHFFAVDSDSREPDGVGLSSTQAEWLQAGLAASTAPWKIVYFHHPPFSSGQHGGTSWMDWPFKEWGANAVLSGHDHTYERLLIDGLPYFVDGLGGAGIYYFLFPARGSKARYNDANGAMLVTATAERITFQFFNIQGDLIDSYDLLTDNG